MQAYPGIIVSTYIHDLRDEDYMVPVKVYPTRPQEVGTVERKVKHIHPYSDALIVYPTTAINVRLFPYVIPKIENVVAYRSRKGRFLHPTGQQGPLHRVRRR